MGDMATPTKRFVIVAKRRGDYIIPVIETREFACPKKLGSYCAEDGSLWTSLDDGKKIFASETEAANKLADILRDLFHKESPT